MRPVLFLLLAAALIQGAPLNRLLVISVDGLDHRYLSERDSKGLKIPNIRALIAKGELADGVVGVVPTVTWPSHTTIITGVRPFEHGIRGNRRPASEGGDYYWTSDLLKSKTLWQKVKEAGGTTAAITWPVTLDAAIDFNLPEFFRKRNGGAMDFAAIAEKSTPGLIEKIKRRFPAFGTQWVDDRARALATIYLLESERPNLVLLHLVDLDSEQHDRGPFTPESYAMLEYTDDLIGTIVRAAPGNYRIVLTSDHGFEQINRQVNPMALARGANTPATLRLAAGLVLAGDAASAAFLRGKEGIGREVPLDEINRFAPELTAADPPVTAFEPAPNHQFSAAITEPYAPISHGEHGLWPGRPNYRSVFIAVGPGIKPSKSPEISMLAIAGRLAGLLGLPVGSLGR